MSRDSRRWRGGAVERIEGQLRAMRPGSCGHTCRAGGRRGVAHRQRERRVARRHELVWRERAGVAVTEGRRNGRQRGSPMREAGDAPAARAVGPDARGVDARGGERSPG